MAVVAVKAVTPVAALFVAGCSVGKRHQFIWRLRTARKTSRNHIVVIVVLLLTRNGIKLMKKRTRARAIKIESVVAHALSKN